MDILSQITFDTRTKSEDNRSSKFLQHSDLYWECSEMSSVHVRDESVSLPLSDSKRGKSSLDVSNHICTCHCPHSTYTVMPEKHLNVNIITPEPTF